MKKERETTLQFLKELEYLARDVKETIRVGDDGFGACSMEQLDEIISTIRGFVATHLAPEAPAPKISPPYLAVADSLDPASSHTMAENIAWYKAHLYHYIKRNLSKIPPLDEIAAASLETELENHLIIGSRYEKEYFSNDWYYSGVAVIRDIAAEITDALKARPQRQLF
jgi:hypothetical protein